MTNTPCNKAVMNVDNDISFQTKKYHNTFGYRIRNMMSELGLEEPNIAQAVRYISCPWSLPITGPCESIGKVMKARTPPAILRDMHICHLREEHSGETVIYTDGSKKNLEVGCAAILPDRALSRKLPPYSCIFTAEIHAISVSLATILSHENNSFVIFSDSRSAIDLICNNFSRHPLIHEIHMWISILERRGKSVKFCWVPSHVGLYGNEKADEKAREAASSQRTPVDIQIPARDYYGMFREVLDSKWSTSWRLMNRNKLRTIKDKVQPWNCALQKDRTIEVIMARIRISHTRLTHGFLLEGAEAPLCLECIVPLTVVHILIECPEYNEHRRACFGRGGAGDGLTVRDVIYDDDISVSNIFRFLQRLNLINRL